MPVINSAETGDKIEKGGIGNASLALSLDEREEVIESLGEKLNKQRKMVGGIDRLLQTDVTDRNYEIRANSRRREFQEKIDTIEAAIDRLKSSTEGTTSEGNLPFCNLVEAWPMSLEKLNFQVCQAREKILQEGLLCEWAQKSIDEAKEVLPVKTADNNSWLNTDPRWQVKLAKAKVSLLRQQLSDIQGFFDLRAIPQITYQSSAVDGEIKIKIPSVNLPEEEESKEKALESLLIQVWIDGWASHPYKLKRNGDCEISKMGIHRELCNAKSLEILVFDKKEQLVGFCGFQASWLKEFIETTFDRTLKDRLHLIPSGSIELDISLARNAIITTGEDSSEGKIKRQLVIRHKTIERLGHLFVPSSRQGLARILKCAHCEDHIYGRNGVKCSRCRFASHKSCIDDVFIRCIADPNFERWETMTKTLMCHAHPHNFKTWSLKTPSFCDHCGKVIPVGTSSTDCLKCHDCGKFFHTSCEPYVAALCGLKRSDALRIVKKFHIEEEPRSSRIEEPRPVRIGKNWTSYSLKEFEFISVIGKGNFGKVMLVKTKSEGKLFALKILKKDQIIEGNEFESVRAEHETLALVSQTDDCPFLVRCHGLFQSHDRLFLLMDFIAGGDLMFHIQHRKFTFEEVRLIAAEVFLALEFLHLHGILYRDLKLDNILVDLDGHIKLTDYGLCKLNMGGSSAMTNTFCGTPEFMAPEILQEQPYGLAVDWWAFGIFLYEMLQNRAPFHGKNEQETFHRILTATPTFTPDINPQAHDLIKKLLVRDPLSRLGGPFGDSKAIKKHPFFADLDWTRVRKKAIDTTFKPQIMAPVDVSNFEAQFTREKPILTPLPSLKLSAADEAYFKSLTK